MSVYIFFKQAVYHYPSYYIMGSKPGGFKVMLTGWFVLTDATHITLVFFYTFYCFYIFILVFFVLLLQYCFAVLQFSVEFLPYYLVNTLIPGCTSHFLKWDYKEWLYLT